MNALRRSPAVDALEPPAPPEAGALAALGRFPWPRFLLATVALLGAVTLGVAIGPAGIPLDATVRIVLSRLPGVERADSLPLLWRDIIWRCACPGCCWRG